MKIPPIAFQTVIAAEPDAVFTHLATAVGLERWFATSVVLDPIVGGVIEFVWEKLGVDGTDLRDGGHVVAYEPNRKFAFTWTPGETGTTVEISLTKAKKGTLVRLTESGHSSSAADLKALVDCASGWGEALTNLRYLLEKPGSEALDVAPLEA